ncbi:MAG: ABC transporter substrate-binding protein [Acetobacteraceae bacterium]
MDILTRRQSLLLGAGAVGGAALLGEGAHAQSMDAGIPVADVKPPNLPIEKGATLKVLRPAKFIAPDETLFRANTKKFTEKTGVDVELDFISWEQLRPQTAVTANTGAGPDIIVGWSADPQIYATKLVPLNDIGEYLGAKYGGWYDLAKLYGTKWGSGGKQWISIPMGGGSGPAVYRVSWVKEAGFDTIPNDLNQFLTLCQKLKKIGHPCGFALGHAVGDANGFCNWLLWSHGAYAVDEQGKVAIDSQATIDALNYCKELYPTMISGVTSWNDASNNQAYVSGQIGLTFNGVSIYYVLKNSPDKHIQAMAEDTNNVLPPFGKSQGHPPMSALVVNAMLFKHSKYPNAAKEYIRFMMEAPQYGAWLSSCLGYWSEPLQAYAKMAFWNSNPKIAAYKSGMDTPYYDGYKGPIGSNSSALAANYILVDMFAKVATGNSSAASAAKFAAKQAQRYYPA